jgi:structural maintenance of chromosome 3 (chondroitin sulfate proteoglycan 6)
MYIKQVTIQGFRSYRDSTGCEQFSKKHNLVVGRNGSGKSNFFTAIQFVLSDEFNNLRAEQRVNLLHEGTGPRVISAMVEIVFDNSDRRLPIQRDEVAIRRVIGNKKDQYYLEKKITTKKDIVHLLEAAGFSRSNPYYIVKQGKINEMTTQSEKDRLELLKEVAGTRVYDDKRSESMKLKKETEDTRGKIVALLSQIVDKLESLEEEKEELTQYQKFDKERRAFEYLIFEEDRKAAQGKLERIKAQRESHREEKNAIRQQAEKSGKQLSEAKRKLNDVDHRLSQTRDEKEANSNEKDQNYHQITRIKLEIDDLKLSVDDDNASKEGAKKQHEQLRRQIFEKRAELDQLRPQYSDFITEEKAVEREKQKYERRRDELYAKQGRQNRFNDQNQRDTWLNGEIEKVNVQIRQCKKELSREESDIEKVRNENNDRNDAITQCRIEMQKHKGSWDNQNNESLKLKRQKEDLVVKQNEYWRNETKLTSEKQQISTEQRNKESQLQGMIGRSILNGINAIKEVKKRFQQQNRHDLVDGYLGTLIDCFTTEQSFFTAVEVTAGSRLFHHVVSTSAIGNDYLAEMNKMKLQGEVTFLPLDRLQARREEYPQAADALPLINKITYDGDYEIVMRYVFGKTLICRNMEVATKFARLHGLDCITLDGDQVSRRGALTGGYIDTKRSRLELHHSKIELRSRMDDKEAEYRENRSHLSQIDTELNNFNRNIQNVETELSKCKELYDRHSVMFSRKTEEYRQYLKSIEERENHLSKMQMQAEQLEQERDGYQEELGSSMSSQLTSGEHNELKELNSKIQDASKRVEIVADKRIEVEKKKTRIETLLNDNLCKREEQLKRNMDQLEDEERKSKLTEALDQFKRLEQSMAQITDRQTQIKATMDELEANYRVKNEEVEKLKRVEDEAMKKMTELDREFDKMASKESIYLEKAAEAGKKVRELGAIPTDLFERYEGFSTKLIYKKLDDANRHLKKYGHVNKKALDQFMSFSEERTRLENRRDELNSEEGKIAELVEYLDTKKLETIQMTFEKISDNFSEIFKKLGIDLDYSL